MIVIIHTFSKDRYHINVEETDVVMDLFIKLKELLTVNTDIDIDIDIDKCKLVYSGILLNPNKTFEFYKIKDGENIHFIY